MKRLIRTFVFVLISIECVNFVLSSLFYGNSQWAFFIVCVALTALFFFSRPFLAIFGLPNSGLGFVFIGTILSVLTLYVLTMFLPEFMVLKTTVANLNIFGFVLPSKSLTVFWSALFSAFILSLVYTFLEWLSAHKK